jgi:small GTP-binding protein
MADSAWTIKIVLLGEAGVGKTSLVYQFMEKKFRENYKQTLGVNLLKKDMHIEGYGGVSAQIWDLGGQEPFKALRKLYLEGANGGLVIFDLTERNTFDKLPEWIESFKNARGEQPLILIGNKSDLENKIKIEENEAQAFSNNNNVELVITSAKTGYNVEEVFTRLTRRILDNMSNK